MIKHEIEKINSNYDNSTFMFKLKISMDIGWIENVKVFISDTKKQNVFELHFVNNDSDYSYFETQITLETKAIYHYYFSFDAGKENEDRKVYVYKKINQIENQFVLESEKVNWKLAVNFDVPDWAQNAVMYHIFVDRYKRGNSNTLKKMPNRKIHKSWDELPTIGPDEDGMWNVDFYGGDLKGIEETLPYLKDLGVDIIYLSPIVKSPSNHRYDTGDYFEIDPYIGNDDDLKNLCESAHKIGIRIIIDAVFNHIGNNSKYFNQCGEYAEIGAFQSDKSEYSEFFRKNTNNAPDGKKWYIINQDIEIKDLQLSKEEIENFKTYIFEKDLETDEWKIIDSQGIKKDISKEIVNQIEFTLKPNEFDYWWKLINLPECDGYSEKWKDYILGDNGVIVHWFSLGIDGLRLDVADELTDEFIEKVRITSKRMKEDAFLLGEVWKNPMKMNRGYIESGKGMDSVMNYQLADALIRYIKYADIQKLRNTIYDILTEYPDGTINSLMNFTSTHDISRIIEIFGNDDGIFQKYGEWSWNLLDESTEWAKAHNITESQYELGKEIYKSYFCCLAFFPGTISIFYGDEVGMTGIGNLANRGSYPWGRGDEDIYSFIKKIIDIRKNLNFKTPDFHIVKIDENQFVFERFDSEKSVLVAINRKNEEVKFELPKEYENSKILASKENCSKEVLSPYGMIILLKS